MESKMKRFVITLLLLVSILAWAGTDKKEYVRWMQESLPECPQFDAWLDATGALPPDFESLPSTNLLPDPYTFMDGSKVTDDASWERRREEIKTLYKKYLIGEMPPKPAIDKVELLSEVKGEGYVTRTVKLIFGPEGKGSVRVGLTIPQGLGKCPVFLSTTVSGMGNTVLRRGYISAGFAGSDFMDDGAALKELYPDYNFSALARRAWLISLVLDYFETVPEVDMSKIAVYGYSRDAKMVTIATVFDERIAAMVAGSTGVGGLLPWRYAGERGGGESIESTTRMFPDWFIPELRFFAGKEDRLPVDANLLLSVIAPRAVLMEWGYNDEVANGWAQERAYDSAVKVYARYGAETRLGMLSVPGFHGGNDMQACLDFLDIQFGRSNAEWKYRPVFPWSFEKWAENCSKPVKVKDYPVVKADAPVAGNLKSWEIAKKRIKAEVLAMLGRRPVTMEDAPAPAFFRRPDPAGPVEALDGKFNPGQLRPDVPAWVISRKIEEFGWNAENGAAAASKRISFGPDKVRGDLFYPVGTPEGTRLPTVVWLHGFHYPLGYMWVYRNEINPILSLVKAGFAVLAFDQTGFGQRYEEYAPFYDRYPEWSRLGRMVEDVQDAVTALQKESLVDSDNITLYGFAMGGTVALYSAALDERVKNVVSVCGFTPMRSDVEGTGMSGMTRYSHLYGMLPKLGFFAGEESRLPYDYEDLIALAAPRGVMVVQPSMDRDADPAAVHAAVDKARHIFRLQGAEKQLYLSEPDDYGRLSDMTQINIVEWIKNHS